MSNLPSRFCRPLAASYYPSAGAWQAAGDTEDTTVLQPELSITKNDSIDPILLGEQTQYTIVITNTGEATLTAVTASDLLPAGLSFVSSAPVSESDNALTWSLGELAPGAFATITVDVTGDATGTFTNTAQANAKEIDEPVVADEPTTVNAPETPPVYSASIDKVDTDDPIREGDTTDYIITVKNTGNQPLTKVTVADTLPATFSFVSSPDALEVQDNDIIGGLGVLEPGQEVQVTFKARSSLFGEYLNVAELDAAELKQPILADETTLVEQVAAEEFAISIEKTDDVDPAKLNQDVTFTIKVTNEGISTLTNVEVTDKLPEGFKFKSADTEIAQTGNNDFSVTFGDLDPGESRTFKLVATALVAGTFTNVAEVITKEIDEPEIATEDTTVVELVAAEVIVPETLPFTGFPRTLWWLAAIAILASGTALEISNRRRRATR